MKNYAVMDLEDLRKEADSLAAKVNEALLGDSMATINEAKTELEKAVEVYNHNSKHEALLAVQKAENPMYFLAMGPTFKTIKVKEEFPKKNGDGAHKFSVKDATGDIDPLEAETYNGNLKTIGNKADWSHYVSQLTYRIALRTAYDIGESVAVVKERYKIDAAAMEIDLDLKDGYDPTSMTQMIKSMQKVVDAMIYEAREDGSNKYRVTSWAVKYADKCFTSRGKERGTVRLANIKTVRLIMVDIINHIITGKPFELTGYKAKKGARTREEITQNIFKQN